MSPRVAGDEMVEHGMSGSFVMIVGRGMSIMPRPPFGLRIIDDAIEVSGLVDDEEHQVTVRAGDELPGALGEVGPGPDLDGFILQIGGVYEVPWPAELALVSAPAPEEPPFFMLSDLEGGLVYVQGPMPAEDAPEISATVGTGQREIERGETDGRPWIEFAYDHDGVAWRQRHIVAEFGPDHRVIITTQAQAERCELIHRAANAVAATMAPVSAA